MAGRKTVLPAAHRRAQKMVRRSAAEANGHTKEKQSLFQTFKARQMLYKLLDTHTALNIEEATIKKQLVQFLGSTDNAYGRDDNLVAHVVGDAWIVNPARTHVLLVEHALNHHWMAPGGHCDGNPDVMEVLKR